MLQISDLTQALAFLSRSFISEKTQQEALKIINDFKKVHAKESPNVCNPK